MQIAGSRTTRSMGSFGRCASSCVSLECISIAALFRYVRVCVCASVFDTSLEIWKPFFRRCPMSWKPSPASSQSSTADAATPMAFVVANAWIWYWSDVRTQKRASNLFRTIRLGTTRTNKFTILYCIYTQRIPFEIRAGKQMKYWNSWGFFACVCVFDLACSQSLRLCSNRAVLLTISRNTISVRYVHAQNRRGKSHSANSSNGCARFGVRILLCLMMIIRWHFARSFLSYYANYAFVFFYYYYIPCAVSHLFFGWRGGCLRASVWFTYTHSLVRVN